MNNITSFISNASTLELVATGAAAWAGTWLLFVNLVFKVRSFPVHKSGAVVVTGSSSGIGRHFVEYFAKRYPSLIVYAGVRKESDAEKIRGVGLKNLKPLMIDVTKHESCVKAIAEVEKTCKEQNIPFVALVNNAGGSRYNPIEFTDIDDARSLFETNFFGLLDLTKLALPLIRESKGRVVNISSVAGIFAPPCQGLYCATKFAVEAISDSLRREVSHFGVSVSLIEPAYVKTPILETTRAASQLSNDKEEELKERIYDKFYSEAAKNKKLAEVAYGSDPVVVSRAIDHAITSKKPRVRYTVANALFGIPAWVLSWLFWFLPARGMDKVLGC